MNVDIIHRVHERNTNEQRAWVRSRKLQSNRKYLAHLGHPQSAGKGRGLIYRLAFALQHSTLLRNDMCSDRVVFVFYTVPREK